MKKVFLISPNEEVQTFCNSLVSFGYDLIICPNLSSAWKENEESKDSRPSMILLGFSVVCEYGMEIIQVIINRMNVSQILVVSYETAPCFSIKSVEYGAVDYIVFPCTIEYLVKKIEYYSIKSFYNTQTCNEEFGKYEESCVQALEPLLGSSIGIKELKRKLIKFSKSSFSILIEGETGTGKTLVARIIHELSERRSSSFIGENMSTIPESLAESYLFGAKKGSFTGAMDSKGMFEKAHEGTLFLDEISELPLLIQPKLLKVIQEKRFHAVGSFEEIKSDFRLICATNSNLKDCVKQKSFREDLFHRIAILPIKIPALRERISDIPELVSSFLDKSKTKITTGAMQKLMDYNWPGNIRELENTISLASVICNDNVIKEKDISFYFLDRPAAF